MSLFARILFGLTFGLSPILVGSILLWNQFVLRYPFPWELTGFAFFYVAVGALAILYAWRAK